MPTLAITYRKNPQYSEDTPWKPRLFATVDLSRYGVATRVTDLPIYFRKLEEPVGPIRVVYATRVAGLPVEKGNLGSLVTALDGYLAALTRFGRLPEYVFYLGSDAWPIYRLTGELVTRYPGGPVFSAANIAELRIWLADHFKHMGRIRNRKELGVLYLSPSDLQLCSPEFSLRAPDMADIPVFTTKNGRGMQWLTPAGDPPITVPINSGAEIFDLYREVSRYLLEQGRIEDGDDISIRKLSADAWARAQVTLEPQGKQVLCYEAEVEGRLRCWQVPVFTNGHDLIAARTNRLGRVTLYFGPDLWALQRRLAEDLYTGGTISSPGSVRVVTVQAPDAGAETAQRPVSLLDSVLQNGFFGEKSLKAQC